MTAHSYDEIIQSLEDLNGPDREIDVRIAVALNIVAEEKWWSLDYRKTSIIGRYTASIDDAVALLELMLPGWAWTIGKCHLSDDAWTAPDFNSPQHGERLRAELLGGKEVEKGDVWDGGFDVDLRPQRGPQIALLIALFQALEEKGKHHDL